MSKVRIWVYEGRDALMRLRPNCLFHISSNDIDFRSPGKHPLELVFGLLDTGTKAILGELGQTRSLITLGFFPFYGKESELHTWNLDLLTEEWKRLVSFYVVQSNVRTLKQRRTTGR